ncbi:hypothetical protein QQM41_04550 [Acetobacter sp. AC2005]|uniref:hypothetical protein n=1 Tax=Acetobacter sp. AC2005 TaxID=3134142 RepID=UPI0030CA7A4B
MSQSQPAMTLKLLSLRREGECLSAGKAEVTIGLTSHYGTLPVAGTLTVTIPEGALLEQMPHGVNSIPQQVLRSIVLAYYKAQEEDGGPVLA